MIAIQKALEWIKQSDVTEETTHNLYSDSLSVLQSIQTGTSKSRPNLIENIKKILKELAETGVEIAFHWIPSHVGIPGNEKADELAKGSLTHETVDIRVGRELGEAYGAVDQRTMEIWQRRWTNDEKGRHYYNIQPNVNKKIKFSEKE